MRKRYKGNGETERKNSSEMVGGFVCGRLREENNTDKDKEKEAER